jgi:hypothetical protein
VLICDGMLFDKKSRLQLNFYYKFPFWSNFLASLSVEGNQQICKANSSHETFYVKMCQRLTCLSLW